MVSLAELNRWVALAIERTRPDAISACITRLDRAEISWVQRQNRLTRNRWLRACAIALTTSANGWIYLFLGITLLVRDVHRGAAIMVAGALSVLISHAVYAFGKAFEARPRPFARHPSVEALRPPLDLYSFPSGHCMTASAVWVAVGTGFPEFIAIGVALCVLLAWARVACAHHYPTDLVGGAALGAAIALPISQLILR
jgi:undecaprenyl-diphosphatase